MNNGGNGEAKVMAPKKRLEPLVPAADFSEIIMQLVGDPNCKTCYGRYWIGFLKQPDGSTTLQVCHCASFAETQVVTVLRAVAVMANDQDRANRGLIEIAARMEKNQAEAKNEVEAIKFWLRDTPRYKLQILWNQIVEKFRHHDKPKDELDAKA